MLSCNGSLERREGAAYMEFDVEAPSSASRKRGAVSGKSLISCHPSELGGAGVVESMAVSGLSKSPAPGSALVARLSSSTSSSEALESSSPSRTIGSSIPR
jgi:hypothetical protein